MSRSRRDYEERRREGGEGRRSHGDMGYVGERERRGVEYSDREGGCVDALLTSDVVPSFYETVRYAVKHENMKGMAKSDMPKGPGAKQSGPLFGDVHAKDASRGASATDHMKHGGRKKMAAGGVGKERKGQY